MNADQFKSYQSSKKAELEELKNSKDKPKEKGKTMFTFFKKKEVPLEEGDSIENAIMRMEDGTEVSVQEMIDTVTNAKKNEKDDDKKKADMGMMVNVDGEDMSVKELMNRYKKGMKKNADDEEKAKKDEMDKKNEEDDKKRMDDEKKNSTYAKELENAIENGKAEANPLPMCMSDKVALGSKRYGSGK